MRLAILADPDSWYFRDLDRAATRAGHTCLRGDFSALASCISQGGAQYSLGVEINRPVDAIIVRSMPPGSLEQVVLRMDVLARLEATGVPVVNPPKSLECAIDKYLTTARLAAAGIPVPETACCQTAEQALEWFHRFGSDVVVKPIFGSEGRGIVRVSDPDMAWRVFTTLERLQSAIYLQQFVDHGGTDLRLLVLNGRVLGAIRRRSASDFRTNVARQGTAEPHPATAVESDLALRSAGVVGAPFAGVDVVYDRLGRAAVLEVNAVPGWKAFARVNGQDVAAQLLAYIEERVRQSVAA